MCTDFVANKNNVLSAALEFWWRPSVVMSQHFSPSALLLLVLSRPEAVSPFADLVTSWMPLYTRSCYECTLPSVENIYWQSDIVTDTHTHTKGGERKRSLCGSLCWPPPHPHPLISVSHFPPIFCVMHWSHLHPRLQTPTQWPTHDTGRQAHMIFAAVARLAKWKIRVFGRCTNGWQIPISLILTGLPHSWLLVLPVPPRPLTPLAQSVLLDAIDWPSSCNVFLPCPV